MYFKYYKILAIYRNKKYAILYQRRKSTTTCKLLKKNVSMFQTQKIVGY